MFGFKKKQQGVISPTLILVIIAAVVAGGGAAWIQQVRLNAEVANTKLVQGKLDVANAQLTTAASVNETLKAELATWKKLAEVNQELAKAHEDRANIIRDDAARRDKALPKVTPKASEAKQTTQQIENSRLRSEEIFEAFCSADPGSALCAIPAVLPVSEKNK